MSGNVAGGMQGDVVLAEELRVLFLIQKQQEEALIPHWTELEPRRLQSCLDSDTPPPEGHTS